MPIAAAPASIGDLQARYDETYPDPADAIESFGEFVIRLAGIALDVSERRLEGRRYKVPRSVMAGVQSNPAFKSAIAELRETSDSTTSELTATTSAFRIVPAFIC